MYKYDSKFTIKIFEINGLLLLWYMDGWINCIFYMHSKDITHLHGGCCYDNYDKNLMIYESLMLLLNSTDKYYGTRSTLDLVLNWMNLDDIWTSHVLNNIYCVA